MATTPNPAAKELYPLSTQDGQSIPLDVIYPVGLIRKVFEADVVTSLIVPETFKMASFFSEEGCIVQFGDGTLENPLVSGAEYLNTLLIPPNTIIVSAVTTAAGGWSIVSYEGSDGVLWVQQIKKWAGLALERQVNIK